MTIQFVVHLVREVVWTTLMVVGPLLAVGFVIGLIVSIFQAVMQLQEVTLGFVPKILALSAALVIFANWMLTHLLMFARKFLGSFDSLVQ